MRVLSDGEGELVASGVNIPEMEAPIATHTDELGAVLREFHAMNVI